jgi:hypothetical protein
MDPRAGESGGPVPADPAAIRAEMAKTRAALTRKLGALKGRLFGTPSPERRGDTTTMPQKKGKSASPAKKKLGVRAGATVKKAATAKKAPAAKAAAGARRATTAKKAGAAKKAKKAGGTKTLSAKRATTSAKKAAAGKKGGQKTAARRKKKSPVVAKAKEVLTGVLAGAVKGAAGAVATEAAKPPLPSQPEEHGQPSGL